jgi:hypothetical protein
LKRDRPAKACHEADYDDDDDDDDEEDDRVYLPKMQEKIFSAFCGVVGPCLLVLRLT